MVNAKRQDSTQGQNLSADDILANIRKRLGIQETAQETAPQAPQASQARKQQINAQQQVNQVRQAQQPQSQNAQTQQQYQPQSSQQQQVNQVRQAQQPQSQNAQDQTHNFDDDFSFDLDFNSTDKLSSTNVNKAYRAYQNAMKSNYQEEEQEDFDLETQDQTQEWDEEEDSRLEEESFEFDQDEEDYADESEEGFQDEEEMDDFEDEEDSLDWDEEEDEQQHDDRMSNVHFLENSRQHYSNKSIRDVASNIQTMITQIIEQQISEWCENNLEDICRDVVRQELYKENNQN